MIYQVVWGDKSVQILELHPVAASGFCAEMSRIGLLPRKVAHGAWRVARGAWRVAHGAWRVAVWNCD